MFRRIKELIKQEKELVDAMYKASKENELLQSQSIQLLAKIQAAEKRSGVLLLEDLSEELIKKLQSLTDDNVIIFFLKDGTRMEIRKDSTNYRRNEGFIR